MAQSVTVGQKEKAPDEWVGHPGRSAGRVTRGSGSPHGQA